MSATSLRHPAVAGRFYPGDPAVLHKDVRAYLSEPPQREPVRALGCIAPHAGYMYSGHVAGAVFAAIEIPEYCIVLCPNHTGMGRPLSFMREGGWQTPLGEVPIATQLADRLKEHYAFLEEDSAAHRNEHAIEVELPFLQSLQPKLSFVPIAVGTADFRVLQGLGLAIAEAVSASNFRVLIVASSDMNHYESDAVTRVKDRAAIEPILRLDVEGLHHAVTQQNISMCGYGPAIAMLTAVKKLGGISAELVKYATSGDVSGDRNLVVGYAGIIVPAPQ